MGDNGGINEKSQEEILQEKVESFKEHPEDWVHLNRLILAVRKDSSGNFETLVAGGRPRPELEIALMRLTHYCYGIFNAMSYAQQKGKEIIQPKGSMLNFARRFKK